MKISIKNIILVLTTALFFLSCKKGGVQLSANADELFWLSNKGADMPVWVMGNTASKTILLFLHGGPGIGAHRYSGFQTNQLQKPYAVGYWDQRDAGSSAGNSNFNDLTLDLMIEDLEKLISVLQYRYGGDVKIFLMGHSFGGLLGSGFLIKGDNQKKIRGWIEVDGAHDYPETNILSRKMLIDSAAVEIAKGRYVPEWTAIKNYCESHQPNTSLDVSYKINVYAHDVEKYVDINHITSPLESGSESSLASFGINLYHIYYTASGKKFLQSLEAVSFTSELKKITIPSLLIWGQYDFNVPMGSGKNALAHLGAAYKQLHIMPHSGHTPMNGDTDLFAKTVIDFIEAVK
jgi:proline iminopeptidase